MTRPAAARIRLAILVMWIAGFRIGTASERAEDEVRPQLPFPQHVDHALLIAGTDAPCSWRKVQRLPLGYGS